MLDAVTNPDDLKYLLSPMIEEISLRYNVNSDWIRAIVTHESRWNLCAVRFEPSYRWLYQPEKYVSGLNSLETEINTQKTSWGLGQVMGALAREKGHTGFTPELLMPEINLEFVAMRLAELKKKAQSDSPDVIFAGYNGGPGAMRRGVSGAFSNQRYVNAVRKHLIKSV